MVRRGRLIGAKVNNVVICITKWNVSQNANKIDVTNSCSPGEGNEYQEGAGEDTGGWEGFAASDFDIHDVIEVGGTYPAELYYDKGVTTNKYAGDIFIESIATAGEIKSQFTQTVAFTVIGDLEVPTAV